MSYNHRHTKIVATLGPATEDEATLESLINHGVDICRLNMAHAEHDWIREIIKRIRSVSKKVGRPVAIMMDIKGPEIRTGNIDGVWNLELGEKIRFLANDKKDYDDNIRSVTVNYPGIIKDLQVGNTMLVDNGLIQLQIIEMDDHSFVGKVTAPGEMKSKRHINLPGVTINLPAITDKDRADIEVGLEGDIGFYALSFVRKAEDVEELRRYLHAKGSSAKIISKLEDQSAIRNLDAIVQASDAVMVARGDLGIECPFEQIPMLQHRIVQTSITYAKPVIVATHMLESMITAPVPTRAEVSDVANAIFEQADAIMLSGETSVGKYPVECVQAMTKIANEVEKTAEKVFKTLVELNTPREKMARSALGLAQELGNAPIVVFSKGGHLPQVIAAMRPNHCPIYAITESQAAYKHMLLCWGINPLLVKFSKDPEHTLQTAMDILKQQNLLRTGQWIIAITGVLIKEQFIDTIQIRCLD